MSDDLNVTVSYTVGLGANPLPSRISANCQNSFVLQTNHEHDTVLQRELQELEEVRNFKRVYTDLAIFFDEVVVKNQKYKQPPNPPPPPPPPPVGENGPPAPPQQVTFEEYAIQLSDERKKYEAREAELVELVSGCINTRTQICGLPKLQARSLPLVCIDPCSVERTVWMAVHLQLNCVVGCFLDLGASPSLPTVASDSSFRLPYPWLI
jgi:hypothetical protein